jgi:putative membrane protein
VLRRRRGAAQYEAMSASDHEPDYRFTLANERTFLAYARTALAFTAGGLALVHLVPSDGWGTLQRVLAALLVVVGGIVPLVARRRWGLVQRAMRRDADLPSTQLPSLVGVLLVVAAAVVFGLVVFPAV